MTPRPTLPAVLATLTGCGGPPLSASRWENHDLSVTEWGVFATSRYATGSGDVVVPYGRTDWRTTPATRTPVGRNDDGSVRYVEREAHTITPAEALEMLRDAALWPWEIGDESAPQWWCAMCGGTGGVSWSGDYGREGDWCGECAHDDLNATGGVTADGTLDAPRTLPEVVAVASLGMARLRQIHEHVERLHLASPEIGRSIVWRVMTAEALEKWHGEVEERRLAHPFTTIFSRESNKESKYRERWPAECPYRGWFGYPDNDSRGTHRSWPTLRSLALDCGVHLIDVTPARCVLGVEGVT